ncbi:TPA: hypothetical protein EYP37_02250 [Candidatus Poribacteria bacterium]|nr:hypothetical protein [Candidatus Poribacteria bacterium]
MRYTIPFIVLILIFSSIPAPVLSHDYYPLADGNYWMLKNTDPDSPKTRVIKLKRYGEEEGVYLLIRQTNDEADRLVIREAESGIELLESHVKTFFGDVDFNYDPPQIFFPKELFPGQTWTVSGTTKLGDLTINSISRARVEGMENVEVPAGLFKDCLRIKQDYYINALKISTNYMWLAPEVGIVKEKSASDEFQLVEYVILNKEVAVQFGGKMATVWASIKSLGNP